jgi:hypothetical protein
MTLSTRRLGNSGLQPSSCRSGEDRFAGCHTALRASQVSSDRQSSDLRDAAGGLFSRKWVRPVPRECFEKVGPLWITRKCCGCLLSTTSATSKSVC